MDPTDTTQAQPAGQVTLPPGVKVFAGRETSQINTAGTLEQGVLYPITLANGTTASVFVPNSALGNVSQIEGLFAAKVAALQAIPVG